jgi:hypothetical protein
LEIEENARFKRCPSATLNSLRKGLFAMYGFASEQGPSVGSIEEIAKCVAQSIYENNEFSSKYVEVKHKNSFP